MKFRGDYTMRFRIYDAASGGTMEWDSGDRMVDVSGGVFNVLLGESPQPSISLGFDEDYWLQVIFAGFNQTPRQRLSSAGYAYMASGLVPGTEANGSVTSGTCAAIKGTNTALTGATSGIHGYSNSTSGRGVVGEATAVTGNNYGIYGSSRSTTGKGVCGVASETTGTTYGVYGWSISTSGRGVYGKASATTGMTSGVYGETASTAGKGVYGYASATTGTTYGGRFMNCSTSGGGVRGEVSAISGSASGVYGHSPSTSGRGISGYASAATGITYGVKGCSNSHTGYGGYFSGRLYVEADINASAMPAYHVARIYNASTGTSPDVLALQVGYVGDPGVPINFITFFKGDGTVVGAIEGDGAGGVTYMSGSADFAEFLPRSNPGETMEPGDVVGVYDGQVSRRTHGASQHLVISTRPIVLGNDPGEEHADAYARVAFIGQVAVNVGGEVDAGDLLIPSGLENGTAIAVAPEEITSAQFTRVVGQAWESSADSGVKKVRASIGLLNHDPTVARMAERIRLQEARLAVFEARLAALEVLP